jgi:predicted TIM-barrel fold metal-dependent hydrolase
MAGLKFHPWLLGFSLTDPTFGKICGLAGELKVTIFFYDGTPWYSLPEQIGGLARRFPNIRFVLGHAGLLGTWRSAILAAQRPNVWICLGGPHSRGMELICDRVSAERILWDSDLRPRLSDDIEYRLNLFLRAKIPSKRRDQILGVNPMQLLDYS